MNSHLKPCFVIFWLTILAATVTQTFTLQIETLASQAPADEPVKQLKLSGVDAYYTKTPAPRKGSFYQVRVGSFAEAATVQVSGGKLGQDTAQESVQENEVPHQSCAN